MRNSTIRVTTSTGEGELKKRFGASKSIPVPDTIQEALDTLGESGVLAAAVEKIESEQLAVLRAKLVAKVQGKSAPAADVEEVTDLD